MANENQVPGSGFNLRSIVGKLLGYTKEWQWNPDEYITLADGKRMPKQRAISYVIEQSISRVRQDILKWQMARMQAESKEFPRRQLLYNLFDDVDIDNHISGVIDHQVWEHLIAEPFKIVDQTGKEDETKTAIFESEWFLEFRRLALMAEYWSHSLIQFDLPIKVNGALAYELPELIPRRHVRPERGVVLQNEMDDDSSGIPYRELPYAPLLIEIGGKKTLGRYLKAAPQFIYKKNAQAAWSEFAQIFGAPIRYATTTSRNAADKSRIGDVLARMGSMAYGVFEEGTEIKFIETTRTDAHKVYSELMNFNNAELSKLIIGQTMTTDNGSSRSQSEVHERISDNALEAIKKKERYYINGKLLPMMIQHGFPLTVNDRFIHDKEKDLDGLWEKVDQAGKYYNIDMKWISETFGIPIIDAKPTPTIGGNPSDPNNPGGNDPQPDPKKKRKVAD